MNYSKYPISGCIERKRDDTGIFIENKSEVRYPVSRKQMRHVFDKDIVKVNKIHTKNKGRVEIHIIAIEKRHKTQILGTYQEKRERKYIRPIGRGFGKRLQVTDDSGVKVKNGEVVLCEIKSKQKIGGKFSLTIIQTWGLPTTFNIESKVQAFKYELPTEFSNEVDELCASFSFQIIENEVKKREDLRKFSFVTIDGHDAKDFDDAVFCSRIKNAFSLKVAIADVSHFVSKDDVLDMAARERGTSIYFPRSVIPMFPEKLSNNLCSIQPKCSRLVLICDMEINHEGNIIKYKFYPATIESKARLTYEQVNESLSPSESKTFQLDDDVRINLNNLERLFEILNTARLKRGAVTFDLKEQKIKFDKNQNIVGIDFLERLKSHSIVEECMLCANVCAADFLQNNNIPNLLRVHEAPGREKIIRLQRELAVLGIKVNLDSHEITPGTYHELLSQLKLRNDYAFVQVILMQSLERAFYNQVNLGHFGLAYHAYTHFTSPIRRYPDLQCHRAIKSCLSGAYDTEQNLSVLGPQMSMREQTADMASRDALNWCKSIFMQNKVGQVFFGTITAVRAFGIFVTIQDYPVDGLVHISELGIDYYRYDEQKCQIIGERYGEKFILGARVKVKLTKVDIEMGEIDFKIVSILKDKLDE